MEQSRMNESVRIEKERLDNATDRGDDDFDRDILDNPLFDGDSEIGERAERPRWTDEEKTECRLESGWSEAIMDAMACRAEYDIYRGADLKEAEIGGRPCLMRSDIDPNQKDGMGRTNTERMDQGLAPLTKEGKPIELHHIGQKADSPLAELTMEEHRGRGNDGILHDKSIDSEIDRNVFNGQKEAHWQARAGRL